MAKAVGQTPTADVPVSERALWVLGELRKQPGAIVTDQDGRWLRLDRNTSLISAIAELLPALTVEQHKGISRWLGTEGLRRADNTGRGTYAHFIRLPDEEAGAPAAAAVDELDDALTVLTAATNKILTLRSRLADREAELTAVKAENQKLAAELEELRRRETTALHFSSGVDQLRAAIVEE
jgi:hypothetical protein